MSDPVSYFEKVKGEDLSVEFKDLIVKMLSHNGKDRPTIKEIEEHPWFTTSYDKVLTRQRLQDLIQGNKTTSEDTDSAGADQTIKPKSALGHF